MDTKRIQPKSFTGIQDTELFALYGTAVWGTDEYADSAQSIVSNHVLIGTCKNVSFFISSNDSLAPYTVQLVSVQYGLGGRR